MPITKYGVFGCEKERESTSNISVTFVTSEAKLKIYFC
jgi:hypothetical protein